MHSIDPARFNPDDAPYREVLEHELANMEREARHVLAEIGMPTPEVLETMPPGDEAWASYTAELNDSTSPKDDGIRAHRALLTCLWVREVRQRVAEDLPAAAALAAIKLRLVAGTLLKDAETFSRRQAKGAAGMKAKSRALHAEIRRIDRQLQKDHPLLIEKTRRARLIAQTLKTTHHTARSPLSTRRIRALLESLT